jgi:hypothetical protein
MPLISIGTATIQRNFNPNFVVATTQDLDIRGIFSAVKVPVIQNELTDPVIDVLIAVNTVTQITVNRSVFWS